MWRTTLLCFTPIRSWLVHSSSEAEFPAGVPIFSLAIPGSQSKDFGILTDNVSIYRLPVDYHGSCASGTYQTLTIRWLPGHAEGHGESHINSVFWDMLLSCCSLVYETFAWHVTLVHDDGSRTRRSLSRIRGKENMLDLEFQLDQHWDQGSGERKTFCLRCNRHDNLSILGR